MTSSLSHLSSLHRLVHRLSLSILFVLLLPSFLSSSSSSSTTTLANRIPLSFSHVDPTTLAHFRRRAIAAELPLSGIPATAYMLTMSFGTPPQNFSILVDTGSSNLAVAGTSSAGSARFFSSAASSTFTTGSGSSFTVTYTAGAWTANRVRDVVQVFGSGIAPVTTEFASIYSTNGFFIAGDKFHGILGLAYSAIALPANNPVPPLMDTWVNQGLTNTFGMQLCDPGTSSTAGIVSLVPTPSYIHFGAAEADIADLAVGSFVYAPQIQATYFTVLVTRMAVAGIDLGVTCSTYNSPRPAIVDSGTTNLYVPTEAYNSIVSYTSSLFAFTSETVRQQFFAGSLCLTLTNAQTSAFPSLTITVLGAGNTEFDLTVQPWHYLRIVAVNQTLPAGTVCRVFGIVPSCGTVLGVAVMSSYAVFFDRINSRVGFARSACSTSGGFSAVPTIATRTASTTRSSCPTDTTICFTSSSSSSSKTPLIVGTVIGGVVGLGLIGFGIIWFTSKTGVWGGKTRPRVAAGMV